MSDFSGTSYALPWRVNGTQKAGNYSADDHPRVIFISSRVPAAQVYMYIELVEASLTYWLFNWKRSNSLFICSVLLSFPIFPNPFSFS